MQTVLDLSRAPEPSFANFVEGRGNRAALRYLLGVGDWPSPVALLVGPEGSGKSHLGRAFAGDEHVFVDEADTADEGELFALINRALAGEVRAVLLASRLPVAEWGTEMPDLRSRLRNVPVFTLEEPGDDVLGPILRDMFAAHGREVGEGVVSYMLSRFPRGVPELRRIVGDIEREAQSARADVTKAYVARWLSGREQRELF